MWKLLQIELFKIYKRPRTYIAFAAVMAIVAVVQVALKYDGKSYIDFMMSGLSDTFEFQNEKVLNGYLVCFIILNTLLIHVPLLVALIAADEVAGEANMGTLRLLVTKPVSRTQLILVKFAASVIYVILLLIWMAVLALLISMLIFGTNDMVVLRNDSFHQMQADDVLWRYIMAFGYATVAMSTVAALSLLLSVFADNAVGPIVATISIVIVLTILSEMNIPLYDKTVKPYLFTSHMVAWKGFFYVKSTEEGETIKGSIENLPAIGKSFFILVAYMFLFVGLAIACFKKKDILS
ncbi:MAG: ABC transporter permease subunit [Sphingobacteriales bacterium]|nr:ABC transporter permease subunit [Sphingobacteriales bacterium]MBI3720628.1 ABC transporter permease subunit [Sphingobacteriales bacterium]